MMFQYESNEHRSKLRN